ncbi:MAG: hypothetical protein JXL20_04390 [Deltaproteobacteria bacterium]|nr:hypothetical protein [Deltaproteobacteria bacterium]
MKRKCILLSGMILMVAMLVMMASGAQAEEPQGWKAEITPYAWLAGLSGDMKVQGHEIEFDKSISDLLDAVKIAGGLLGVVQYNRFLVWGQTDYFSLSTDEMDVDQQPKGGRLETKMLLNELALGYQFNGFYEGQTFDALVGFRALRLETDITVSRTGRRFNNTETFYDPMLVLRPSFPLFPSKIKGLRFNPTLAIGGGGDSHLVYELQPQIQYDITKKVSARLGYRTVGYKFEGDNELNVELSGLIFGVGVMF